jgi:sporulation protein YlmC with PRC-barrel domain
MDDMKHRRLQELDRSDFEIMDGEPDIRGWDVKNSAGLKIGEVEELIVDAQQKKIRYMVVDLDDKDLKLPDRKVLIPIGLAELHKEDDDVILPSVTVDQLTVLPAYDKDNLDDEVERKVCTALGRTEERANAILQAGNTTSSTAHTTTKAESHTAETESPVRQPVSQASQTSDTSTSSHTEQPPLGTAEYYGNFYQHAFFSDYNLYKNRQEKGAASDTNNESEYERGLRLWEMRYGGNEENSDATQRKHHEREMSDERRMEMVRNRRKSYEERRSHSHSDRDHNDDHHHHGDNSIIGRIRDEGLQDA